MQHRPQRRGHQRHRARAVPSHRIGPAVQLEAVEKHERPRLADTLQYPKHPADVDEGSVDDRDATAAVAAGAGAVMTLCASMS